jgi:hypothetical protein
MAKKKKKKAAKKTVKKKEVKKKKAKKVTWTGTEKTYPAPKPETVETKSDLPAQPEAKKNCVCCNELVPVSALYLCRSCSFEGCKFCRKSGNCPTCGKPLFQGV